MYEVLLHPDAQKVYINADKALAKKIARCLQQLEQTSHSHPNVKALKGDYAGWGEVVPFFHQAKSSNPLASNSKFFTSCFQGNTLIALSGF